MDWSLHQAFTVPVLAQLTERQKQIFAALSTEWKSAQQLASDAGFTTHAPHESARKYANQLARIHFAEKGGTRARPMWRQPHIVRSIVK